MPLSSVKEINVGANLVPAMLSGRVDATLGAYWNYEAIQLRQLHKHPNVIHMDQVGVPDLRRARRGRDARTTIVNHPDVVRRFVQALARGYESVRSEPAGGRRRTWSRPAPGLDPKLQLASVARDAAVVLPEQSRHALGLAGPARSGTPTGSGCSSNHLISDPNAVLDASTNELLAGQGI